MDTQPQKRFKILLLGDVCVDTTVYVANVRKNPEQNVPLYDIVETKRKGGMSINVEACLIALGMEVTRVTGEYGRAAPSKTRLIDTNTGKYICRIDEDCTQAEINQYMVPKGLGYYDAVVISDYAKGSITPALVDYLRVWFQGPILVDTKSTDLYAFKGCTIKINEVESFLARSIPPDTIITMGERGARIQGHLPVPAHKVIAVDVCGAGDAFLAGLTYGTLHNLDSIPCGIVNAGISVQYQGTYSPTEEELLKGLKEYLE